MLFCNYIVVCKSNQFLPFLLAKWGNKISRSTYYTFPELKKPYLTASPGPIYDHLLSHNTSSTLKFHTCGDSWVASMTTEHLVKKTETWSWKLWKKRELELQMFSFVQVQELTFMLQSFLSPLLCWNLLVWGSVPSWMSFHTVAEVYLTLWCLSSNIYIMTFCQTHLLYCTSFQLQFSTLILITILMEENTYKCVSRGFVCPDC